jgi:8-oxo-dGTP pyrophosphatase MutT (NUDIX family)
MKMPRLKPRERRGRRDAAESEVAAAVCYRPHHGRTEFLLVRTSDGTKWTFPKGHVEQGEDPSQAAAREAREEAGVDGVVQQQPFTYYLYPAGSGRGVEHRVPAFLFEVKSQAQPNRDERFREPQWFDFMAAITKLSEGGRERRYAKEHQRVLETATRMLTA